MFAFGGLGIHNFHLRKGTYYMLHKIAYNVTWSVQFECHGSSESVGVCVVV